MLTYSQRPKVIPQNKFPIDFNAFSCLQESLYCAISRLNSDNLKIVVKVNNRCMLCTIKMMFRLPLFIYQPLNFYKNLKMPHLH